MQPNVIRYVTGMACLLSSSHFLEQRGDVSEFVVRIGSRLSSFKSLRLCIEAGMTPVSGKHAYFVRLRNAPGSRGVSRGDWAALPVSWVYFCVGSPEIIHRRHSQAPVFSEV